MNQYNIRVVEIRDRATFIPALAIKLVPANPEERVLFKEIGYHSVSNPCIILMSLALPSHAARYSGDWRGAARTMPVAHKWIEDNWDLVMDNHVIDVEYILKEVDKPCLSLRDERIQEILDEAKTDEDKELACISLLAAGLITSTDFMQKFLTWRCHICDRIRPDKFISVVTKPSNIGEITVQRNIRYCNDNPECEAKAKE